MTVTDDFRNDLIQVLSALEKKHVSNDDYFKSIMREDKLISFPNKIYPQYLRLKLILRSKVNNAGKLISDKAIENTLDEFLLRLSYSDWAQVKHDAHKEITNLFYEIKKMESIKYLFVIPIMNLTIEEDIQIGDSWIINFSIKMLTDLAVKYQFMFAQGHDEDIFISDLPTQNETKTFVVVIVEAPDTEKAKELAVAKAETCLNVLRLYGSGMTCVIREDYKVSIAQHFIQINLKEGTIGSASNALYMANHFPVILKKDAIEKYKKHVLMQINPVLTKEKDELTDLEDNLLKAMNWYGNAVKEEHKNLKLVNAMVALETLLIPEGGKAKRDLIAKRFVSIVYNESTDYKKKEFFQDMRTMYQLRSSVLHCGESYIYDDDLEKLLRWVQITIQILVKKVDKYKTIFEVLDNEFPVNEKLFAKQKKTLFESAIRLIMSKFNRFSKSAKT